MVIDPSKSIAVNRMLAGSRRLPQSGVT